MINFSKYWNNITLDSFISFLKNLKNDLDVREAKKISADKTQLSKPLFTNAELSPYLHDIYFEIFGVFHTSDGKIEFTDQKALDKVKAAGFDYFILNDQHLFIDMGEFYI